MLSDFRDRLAEGDRADRLLGLALTRIRRVGLPEGRAARASRLERLSPSCRHGRQSAALGRQPEAQASSGARDS
ncbi:hypothetical protein [Actinocorallia libanotica]|uniref:Uncharacterized protein n=1 Tax=Actinocorallia libanotica TaxID=46162 RepID=A0ABP4BNS0_9ACTN